MSVASPERIGAMTIPCGCCGHHIPPSSLWGLCAKCRTPGHADECRKPTTFPRCDCLPAPASFRDCMDGAERAVDPLIPSSGNAMRWRPVEQHPNYKHTADCPNRRGFAAAS